MSQSKNCFQNHDFPHIDAGFQLSGLLTGFEVSRYIGRKHRLFPTVNEYFNVNNE